ncbi:hypothetical protein [Rhodanobacter sp. MP7CTX1]|uniref:AbiU2 domain-containing protein n=1 Tax=Rhodanobacter sp. MP7CTX1 TaxID=2723084 RepID=UPI001609F2D7|nr:hypothetical protein [Rhodanobacter sp. MP7CTX1]MBB6186664.1 hypothetical protein [Rhodanobacter sp. MP7CTX1]
MTVAFKILGHLIDEANAARAHFQVWWALRNLALPEFYDTMNDSKYVQFFHASNSGHYKLVFVALGKIYDSDTRAAGIAELKSALRAEGRADVADKVQRDLASMNAHVQRILGIRNRTVLHNEHALERAIVYEMHGIQPDEIWELIDATSEAFNVAAEALGHSFRVSASKSYEAATLAMLEQLQRGGA